MTFQVDDMLAIDVDWLPIIEANGKGLFHPEEHGIQPGFFATCCHRGFHCFYRIVNGELYLKAVTLGLEGEQRELARRGEGPRLMGLLPRKGGVLSAIGYFDEPFHYEDLPEVIPYSGGILFAQGHGNARAADIHQFLKFKELHEVRFDRGKVTSSKDFSIDLKTFREEINGDRTRTDEEIRIDVTRWFEEQLLSGYDLLKPLRKKSDGYVPRTR